VFQPIEGAPFQVAVCGEDDGRLGVHQQPRSPLPSVRRGGIDD
jgi:hypothetical protein